MQAACRKRAPAPRVGCGCGERETGWAQRHSLCRPSTNQECIFAACCPPSFYIGLQNSAIIFLSLHERPALAVADMQSPIQVISS